MEHKYSGKNIMKTAVPHWYRIEYYHIKHAPTLWNPNRHILTDKYREEIIYPDEHEKLGRVINYLCHGSPKVFHVVWVKSKNIYLEKEIAYLENRKNRKNWKKLNKMWEKEKYEALRI